MLKNYQKQHAFYATNNFLIAKYLAT